MKSLLDALAEGRLIELPDADKDKSLQYLASIIEAVPDFRTGFDFAGVVAARERAANTAIGHGWACPHGRVGGEGDLECAIGWSPSGIAWNAPDGKPVHVVIMHCIPDSEKNVYLREISTLARVIQRDPRMQQFATEKELAGARHRLLDLLTEAVETAVPDPKARMIQLEERQAASAETTGVAAGVAGAADVLSGAEIIPLAVVIVPGSRPAVLSQDAGLATMLEAQADLSACLAAKAPFERSGWRVVMRSVAPFPPDRFLYDCLAIRLRRS